MKLDRFVKVNLVLIALLLALNCVSNFSNSSDSRGNASSSPRNSGTATPGSSRTPLIENKVKAAPPPTQYKAVAPRGPFSLNPDVVEQTLNQQSAQGWEYVNEAQGVLIFKK